MPDDTAPSLKDLVQTRFNEAPDVPLPDAPPNAVHAQLLSHRVRRRYKETPVAPELLNLLLACALSAPAKSDLQQVAIINFADPDKRAAVTDLIPDMPWIKQAPVFLLFCGDGRRIRRIANLRGTTFAHEPLDAFMNAACDAAIVMQNFIVAAEAAGLGCCPISAVREATDEIVALAQLSDGVFPFAGLCVGYPADEPWVSVRLPMRVTVHTDHYDDSDLENELASYDARRDAVNPHSKQRDPARFGEVNDYGWSHDKARQTANADRLSFAAYIKRSGFDIG